MDDDRRRLDGRSPPLAAVAGDPGRRAVHRLRGGPPRPRRPERSVGRSPASPANPSPTSPSYFDATADGTRSTWLGDETTNDKGTFNRQLTPGCYILVAIAPNGTTFPERGRWYQQPICVEPDTTAKLDIQLDTGRVTGDRWVGHQPHRRTRPQRHHRLLRRNRRRHPAPGSATKPPTTKAPSTANSPPAATSSSPSPPHHLPRTRTLVPTTHLRRTRHHRTSNSTPGSSPAAAPSTASPSTRHSRVPSAMRSGTTAPAVRVGQPHRLADPDRSLRVVRSDLRVGPGHRTDHARQQSHRAPGRARRPDRSPTAGRVRERLRPGFQGDLGGPIPSTLGQLTELEWLVQQQPRRPPPIGARPTDQPPVGQAGSTGRSRPSSAILRRCGTSNSTPTGSPEPSRRHSASWLRSASWMCRATSCPAPSRSSSDG